MAARYVLLDSATGTGAGAWYRVPPNTFPIGFQVVENGTGAVTATVNIEATNDPASGAAAVVGTFTLSGTTQATDIFAAFACFDYYRANVTAITGTGAAVTVTRGGGGQ